MEKVIRISPKGIVFLPQEFTGDQYRKRLGRIRESVKEAREKKKWVKLGI